MTSKVLALTLRDVKKWVRNPFMVMMMIGHPLAWLILFGKALNFKGVINLPPELLDQLPASARETIPKLLEDRFTEYLEGIPDYFTYLSIGMLAVIVLYTSSFSGVSLIVDRRMGFLEKLLASPVPRTTIIYAKVFASLLRSLSQAGLLLIVALALGMQIGKTFGAIQLLGVILVISLLSLGLSSLYVAASVKAKGLESRVILGNLLNIPLMFTSNALYPVRQMPSWLQPVASVNPISHSADALRLLIIHGGGLTAPDLLERLLLDIGYLGLFTAVALAIGLFSAKMLKKS